MSDDRAKRTHEVDQALASFRTIGAGLAKMLQSMKAEGVPAEEAVAIVAAYARGFSSRNDDG